MMNTDTQKKLDDFSFALGSWARHLPVVWRKRFYFTTKVLAGLATLLLLLLPLLPGLGVTLPANVEWGAILTGLLTFLGHIADENTHVPAPPDTNPAPEPTP